MKLLGASLALLAGAAGAGGCALLPRRLASSAALGLLGILSVVTSAVLDALLGRLMLPRPASELPLRPVDAVAEKVANFNLRAPGTVSLASGHVILRVGQKVVRRLVHVALALLQRLEDGRDRRIGAGISIPRCR